MYFKNFIAVEYEFATHFDGYSIIFKDNGFELSSDFFDEFGFINKNLNRILSTLPVDIDKRIGNRNIEFYVEKITTYNSGDTRVQTKHENIFIPAQRHLVNLLSERELPDHLLVDYKRFIEATNPNVLSGIVSDSNFFKYKKIIIDLSGKILKGEYAYNNNRKVIYYDIDKYVPLSEASSGQQEAAWIIESIKDVFVSLNHKEYESFDLIIEEPETHLFPEAQRDITYLISLLANQSDSRVIITTHSPYVLAALNNLLKAYSVGQEEGKKEQVQKIVSPLLWVDPARFYVGYMDQGTITDIVDRNTNLITHDMLDKVSDDIMNQFDQLLEIQYDE